MQQSIKAVLRLREFILDGTLPANERLSEPMLADLIGASRTPVRVALVKLEHEGLVEPLPSGGYRIRVFSENDIFDAIELRGTFEGLCARFAAELRPNRSEIDQLTRHLAVLDEALQCEKLSEDDFHQYMQANEAFHQSIVELAHSEVLADSLDRIVALPFASPNAFVMAQAEIPESRGILTIAQHQHHCLVDALRSGEGARAEHLAREHARIAKRNLQIVLNHQTAGKRVPGLQLIKRAR